MIPLTAIYPCGTWLLYLLLEQKDFLCVASRALCDAFSDQAQHPLPVSLSISKQTLLFIDLDSLGNRPLLLSKTVFGYLRHRKKEVGGWK